MNRLSICEGCLEKQRIIDRLTEENRHLQERLRYRQRTMAEGPFGSATPSAKIPIKANTQEENRKKKGGAKLGHLGHGRSALDAGSADRMEEIDVAASCPNCGTVLQDKGYDERSVTESRPIRAERILYRLKKRYCPKCRKVVQAWAPGVLAKALYSNQLVTQTVFSHFLYAEVPLWFESNSLTRF
jgi:hypothetical protein